MTAPATTLTSDITAPAKARRSNPFSNEALQGDLKNRTVRGGLITFLSQIARFVLKTGSTAVLARLLTPADFGLIAMVTVVTGFVELFKDAGLSMATVQRKEINHRQVSTLFWINVGLSIVVAGVVAGLAPVVAWWYGEPRLTLITLALAATLIFGGLCVQHRALLRRSMEYGRLARVEILSLTISLAVGIVAGWYGLGPWALVLMLAAGGAATFVLSFIESGWIPGRPGGLGEVREMLGFGGNLVGFSFVNYAGRNADNLIIGTSLGAGSLGLYSKAYGLLMLPLKQINAPLAAAMIPALSRLQDEHETFRRYYLRAITAIAYVTVPMTAMLACFSHEIVRLVLGPDWLEAADIFLVLAIAAVFQPVLSTVGWVCTAVGQTGRMLRWSFVNVPCIIAAFLTGVQYGTIGVATAYAIAVNLLIVPTFIYCLRGSPVAVGSVLRCLLGPSLIGAVALLIGASFRGGLSDIGDNTIASVVAAGAATFAAGAVAWLVRPIRRDLLASLATVKEAKKSKRKPVPSTTEASDESSNP
ncbi:MAG: lipopolysaccharide biosynthesis protein [Planctomycetota bacterium]